MIKNFICRGLIPFMDSGFYGFEAAITCWYRVDRRILYKGLYDLFVPVVRQISITIRSLFAVII